MEKSAEKYERAHERLCRLRCKYAGVDTTCGESCGEASDKINGPTCHEIMEAVYNVDLIRE